MRINIEASYSLGKRRWTNRACREVTCESPLLFQTSPNVPSFLKISFALGKAFISGLVELYQK